jgi:DNA repair exonuclease SbcCD ATPase subunit
MEKGKETEEKRIEKLQSSVRQLDTLLKGLGIGKSGEEVSTIEALKVIQKQFTDKQRNNTGKYFINLDRNHYDAIQKVNLFDQLDQIKNDANTSGIINDLNGILGDYNSLSQQNTNLTNEMESYNKQKAEEVKDLEARLNGLEQTFKERQNWVNPDMYKEWYSPDKHNEAVQKLTDDKTAEIEGLKSGYNTQIEGLNGTLDTVTQQLEKLQELADSKGNKISELEAKLKDSVEKDERIEELNGQNLEFKEYIKNSARLNAEKDEKIKSLTEEFDYNISEMDKYVAKSEKYMGEVEAERDGLTAKNKKLERNINKMIDYADECDTYIGEVKAERDGLTAKNKRLRNDFDHNISEMDKYVAKSEKYMGEVEAERDGLRNQITNYETTINELKEKLKAANTQKPVQQQTPQPVQQQTPNVIQAAEVFKPQKMYQFYLDNKQFYDDIANKVNSRPLRLLA